MYALTVLLFLAFCLVLMTLPFHVNTYEILFILHPYIKSSLLAIDRTFEVFKLII